MSKDRVASARPKGLPMVLQDAWMTIGKLSLADATRRMFDP